MPQRIGIIGTGGIANNHCQGIQSVPEWQLAAIYDLNMDNARRFATNHEVSESVVCESLEQLLDRVDAVTICTDNRSHALLARAALAKKLPVMCEKPLARNYRESKELADEAQAVGVANYMGMQYRYLPYAQIIKELISSGEMGEVYYYRQKMGGNRIGNENVRLEWRTQKDQSGPGALIDFGVHQVDLYCFFLSGLCGEITEVHSELLTVVKERERLDGSGRGAVTNDDIAAILARTENGALINLTNSRIVPQDGIGTEIVGTKAAVYVDEKAQVHLRKKNPNGSWADRVLVPSEDRHHFPGNARGRQYREFYDIVERGIPYELDFAYGAKAVRVVDAAVLSSETARKVKVSEIE